MTSTKEKLNIQFRIRFGDYLKKRAYCSMADELFPKKAETTRNPLRTVADGNNAGKIMENGISSGNGPNMDGRHGDRRLVFLVALLIR